LDIIGVLTDPAILPFLVVAPIMGLFFVVVGRIYLMQFREGRKAKHRRFKLEIDKIDLSQFADKFKPVNLENSVEVDLEVLNLKRAVVTLSVSQEATKSTFKAILEFRGNTLIVTRSDGELSAEWVVEALDTDYSRRYKVYDILQPVTIRENGKISHSTVEDPKNFLEYLHLLKTLSYVQINNVESRELKEFRRRKVAMSNI